MWCPSQQQIRDLNIAKRVEDIGFYAGFVGENLPNRYDLFIKLLLLEIWLMSGS